MGDVIQLPIPAAASAMVDRAVEETHAAVVRLCERSIEHEAEYQAIMREIRRHQDESELSHVARILLFAHEQSNDDRVALIQLVLEACEMERTR